MLTIAIQVLNLSVYGGEFSKIISPANSANRQTIGDNNEIDSLAEYVTEIILEHKNAFPENGAHNNNSNHSIFHKHISIKLYNYSAVIEVPYRKSFQVKFPFKEDYKFLFLKRSIPLHPKPVNFT